MSGRWPRFLGRSATALLFLFVLVPVVATVAALFFESSRLAHGLRLSAWSDYSLWHATAKFHALRSEGNLLRSLTRSLFMAIGVGTLTAWSAMVCAFYLSRLNFGRLGAIRLLGYSAYLTPPVILVISLGWLSDLVSSSSSALLVLAIGQSAFLFPLNYALAVGHWTQAAYATDRTAASDGAGLFMRFRIHMSSGAPSSAFFGGLALLTFMLSWSDVLFSRYLLMSERHQRLLTDLVIEHLKANDVVAARGELAAVAVLTALVAVAAASAYALMFNKANEVA